MSLRRLLLSVVDPAGAAFESGEPVPPSRPVHRSAAVFGPGEPEGGRPATDQELAELEAVAAAHATDHDAAVEAALRRWSAEFEAAADTLQRSGSVDFRLGGWSVEARIIRFWRGDSLLEISAVGATSARRSRIRIPRDPRRLGRDVLVHYLVDAVAGEA